MSIEGGARVGYVNPDQVTYDYLKGRPYSPKGEEWENAVERWNSIRSDVDAEYDDVVNYKAEDILPTVTWGINPGQAIFIDENLPITASLPERDRGTAEEAFAHMKLREGTPIKGTKVDVAFLGSCTNGRLSDLQEVARYLKGRKVKSGLKAIVVPGSQGVARVAEEMGLNTIFTDAGFEWRNAGCSMCLAMNPDKLIGDQLCASSSNRNFKGRQGSPTGRTILMSPLMVAAAAITGEISDAREVFTLS
ncbi:MAG: aconitase family protein, partial [Chthoniobacterales bacterium]